jgi:hypothetical protein
MCLQIATNLSHAHPHHQLEHNLDVQGASAAIIEELASAEAGVVAQHTLGFDLQARTTLDRLLGLLANTSVTTRLLANTRKKNNHKKK